MCSSPKTQMAKKPTQNPFSGGSLSRSQMNSFAAVANAAQSRREQNEKRKSENSVSTASPAASLKPNRQHEVSSLFAKLLHNFLLW